MTTLQYRVLVMLGALALAIVNAVMFSHNRQVQNELAARGQYIQQSLQLDPFYQSLIKSPADLAAKNNDAQLCELLSSQGISFSANPQTGALR